MTSFEGWLKTLENTSRDILLLSFEYALNWYSYGYINPYFELIAVIVIFIA